MRSLRVWQWLALVKQLTSALRELVLLPPGSSSAAPPILICVSPSISHWQPTEMHEGVDRILAPRTGMGACPPSGSEIKTKEFGGAILVERCMTVDPSAIAGRTLHSRIGKRVGREVLVGDPLDAFGQRTVRLDELLHRLEGALERDEQPHRKRRVVQVSHTLPQPAQVRPWK